MFRLRVKIDAKQVQQLLDQAPEALRAALDRATLAGLALLEARVSENIRTAFEGKPPAVAYATLVNAVFSEPKERPEIGGIVAIHPPADLYALPVETGTRPHFPPVAALVLWVRKKFGLKDPEEAKSAAFAVARSIARRGTKGHFMFERAIRDEQGNVEAEFDRELDQAVAEL